LDAVLDAVARRAANADAGALIRAMRPIADPKRVRAELECVQAMRDVLERPTWSGIGTLDGLAPHLDTLHVPGSVLDGAALFSLSRLLEAGRVVRAALEDPPAALADLRERVCADEAAERRIVRAIGPGGAVLDQASSELARLRRDIARTGSDLVRALERFMEGLGDAHRVADASVTLRGGRYVVPVRREGRSAVGGIVHGQSASGATLFVEPPAQVERMNRLRELELDEEREVRRILAELTDGIRPLVSELAASREALLRLDTLVARARAADDWAAHLPEVLSPQDDTAHPPRIQQGRHPLLLERGINVVPFDLDLDAGERVVVISGPNTGGKTVLLKSLGLLPMLAQCGVIPPVGPTTRLPVFDACFADIGDEQSIDDDLSTFSGHISQVRHVLEEAGPRSLVLLDELGTGTDPTEGAALARATLEALSARGCLTIATSHLGALKRLVGEVPGVANASLQFDPDRVEPTYRLIKGRPGRSYGIQIAKRLALPGPVVTRALELLDGADVRVDQLLQRLEEDEKRSRELAERLQVERDEARTLLTRAQERADALDRRERDARRTADEEARRVLLDARQEVETAIREGRAAAGDADAERAARRRVEEAAQERARRVSSGAERRGADGAEEPGLRIAVGERVRLETGATGTVVGLEEDRAAVELKGGIRLQIPLAQLAGLGAAPNKGSSPSKGTTHWTVSEPTSRHEVDLRGLRVDEVESAVHSAVDQAVLGDLATLRIIHGKGTGAVRSRVLDVLGDDPRISDMRPGVRGEGGHGVTVVTLR